MSGGIIVKKNTFRGGCCFIHTFNFTGIEPFTLVRLVGGFKNA